MSETVLVAETGRATGSAASRRLRAEDSIPAVVYGKGMEPISIAIGRRDLRIALSGPSGMNTILDLTVDGTVYPAIVKDMQRHPVRRTVSHVDFVQIDLAQEITVSVPFRIEGVAREVESNNGLVDAAVTELEVTCTPRNIPNEFVVDVSEMTMDSVIRLADVPMPAGVTPTGDPDSPVVTVLTMRAPVEEELAEGEAAEGEAAEREAEAASGDGGDAGASDDAE